MGALLGALAPDLSLYVMAGTALFLLGIPPERVFGELYFSPAWQQVFAIDNSFPLWALVLCVALWTRRPALVAFAGAALLHLALDFPVHHDDARPHFWPLSTWIFESPISYWDRSRGAQWVGALETLAVLVCSVVLWRRFQDWSARVLLLACAALQVGPALFWAFVFEA